jgi:uncharacterized protein YaaQ
MRSTTRGEIPVAEKVAEAIQVTQTTQAIDRVAIVIVYRWQAKALIEALTARGFAATVVDATGGLLREGIVTMVVGLPRRRLPTFFSLVRDVCPASTRYIPYDAEAEFPWHPECELVVVRAGGANVFVVPVERFVQL